MSLEVMTPGRKLLPLRLEGDAVSLAPTPFRVLVIALPAADVRCDSLNDRHKPKWFDSKMRCAARGASEK